MSSMTALPTPPLELAGISTDQDLDRVGFNEVRRIAIEALAW